MRKPLEPEKENADSSTCCRHPRSSSKVWPLKTTPVFTADRVAAAQQLRAYGYRRRKRSKFSCKFTPKSARSRSLSEQTQRQGHNRLEQTLSLTTLSVWDECFCPLLPSHALCVSVSPDLPLLRVFKSQPCRWCCLSERDHELLTRGTAQRQSCAQRQSSCISFYSMNAGPHFKQVLD